MQKYKSSCQIILVYTINYFIAYKIFNVYISIVFDSYKQYTINNFENLLKKKDGLKNTSVITTPILVRIEIFIRSTRFLDKNISYIIFSLDKKIQENLTQLLLKEFVQC